MSIGSDRSVCAWHRNGELAAFHVLPKDDFQNVKDVVLAPGGSHFVALAEDGRTIVWSDDRAVRLAVSSWKHQGLTLDGFTWSPDGRRLAVALDFRSVGIWDFGDKLEGSGRSPSRVTLDLPSDRTLAWAPDSTHIAAVTDRRLTIASLGEPAREPLRIQMDGPCSLLCWTPNGRAVTVGEKHRRNETRIKTYDARSGRLLSSWLTAKTDSVAWAPDGTVIAILHRPRLASLLLDDVETVAGHRAPASLVSLHDTEGTVLEEHPLDVQSDMLHWSPDGAAVALTRKLGGGIAILDVTDGQTVETGGGPLRAVGWAPDRSRAYVVWDLQGHAGIARPEPVTSTALPPQHLPSGCTVHSAVWSPDGGHVAVVADDVEIWNSDLSGEAIAHLDRAPGYVRALAWAPDSSHIAISAHDFWARESARVAVWDAPNGLEIAVMHRESSLSCPIAWSPDGAGLAGVDGEGAIVIWDAVTGRVARTFSPAMESVTLLAWSPDGRVIASSGEDGIVRLWNTDAGALLMSLPGHAGRVVKASWSPDGAMLATCDAGALRLWATETGLSLAILDVTVPGVGQVLDVSWASDGESISVTCGDNSVRTWSLPDGPAESLRSADIMGVPELTAADRDRYGLPPSAG